MSCYILIVSEWGGNIMDTHRDYHIISHDSAITIASSITAQFLKDPLIGIDEDIDPHNWMPSFFIRVTSQHHRGVSNQGQLYCLFTSLFWRTTTKPTHLRKTAPLVIHQLVIGGFPSQTVSKAESLPISLRNHRRDLLIGIDIGIEPRYI